MGWEWGERESLQPNTEDLAVRQRQPGQAVTALAVSSLLLFRRGVGSMITIRLCFKESQLEGVWRLDQKEVGWVETADQSH